MSLELSDPEALKKSSRYGEPKPRSFETLASPIEECESGLDILDGVGSSCETVERSRAASH
jgi:hypothetical protein